MCFPSRTVNNGNYLVHTAVNRAINYFSLPVWQEQEKIIFEINQHFEVFRSVIGKFSTSNEPPKWSRRLVSLSPAPFHVSFRERRMESHTFPQSALTFTFCSAAHSCSATKIVFAVYARGKKAGKKYFAQATMLRSDEWRWREKEIRFLPVLCARTSSRPRNWAEKFHQKREKKNALWCVKEVASAPANGGMWSQQKHNKKSIANS